MDPLYQNPWDPLARLAQNNPLLGQQLSGQRPAQFPPLSPQEEDSILGKIGGATLGGIGYVGSVLEKSFGGRAIRGLLGGRPRELLSVLPFSDTLGITDYGDRVSGQELLGLQHNNDWGSWLAGLGTELALDPSMYLTFGAGALTGAGRVAKAVGALPKTIAGRATTTLGSALAGATPEVLTAAEAAAGGAGKLAAMQGQHLGGLVGLGLPFQHPSVVLGQGQVGADILSGAGAALRGADAAARSVPFLGPQYGHAVDLAGKGIDAVGRYARAAFDPTVWGATTHVGQQAASEAHAGILPWLAAQRGKLAEYGQALKEANDPTGEILRAVVEGTHQGPVHPALAQVAQSLRGDLDTTLAHLQGLGVNVNELADLGANYLPRYHSPLTKPTPGYGVPSQPLLPIDPKVTGRLEMLKDFAGGTGGINQMLADPAMYQGTALQRAAQARQYLHPNLAPEVASARANDLAAWVAGLDPQYAAAAQAGQPLRFFGNHPLADLAHYYERVARLQAAGEGTQNLLARTALDLASNPTLPHGAQRLTDALARVGLSWEPAINAAGGPAGAQATALGRVNAQRAAQGLSPVADLTGTFVPKSTVDEITRYMRPFTAPEYVSTPLSWLDSLTGWTKALQTAPWPAFHVRNLTSGQVQNLAAGIADSPGGVLKQLRDAHLLQGGETVPGAAQIAGLTGLSDEAATQALGREMYAWGVGGHMPHLANEGVGPLGTPVNLGTDLGGFLGRIPGEQPRSFLGSLQASVPGSSLESWLPWNVAGVRTNKDLFAPVAGGRLMGDTVEGVNRGALYLGLRRQGYTPQAAAEAVIKAHFDYTRGAKTALEANVLSRLIPYYTFSRRNIPYVLQNIAEHPGGLYGTMARVSNDLRQQGGFLPDYLGSGLAIPLGEDEGTRRYLTRLDLPPEQAFENLKSTGAGTGMSLLSQLNPLLKAPLEMATGKQFFTGRDLGDLYSMTGSSTLDQLLSNSPFSRLATTARTLADERKWQSPSAALAMPLNLATGARVTDVDIDKQRNIAAREFVKEQLQHLPEFGKFESIYLRPGMENLLSPEEALLYRLQKTLQKRAQEAAKAQKR